MSDEDVQKFKDKMQKGVNEITEKKEK